MLFANRDYSFLSGYASLVVCTSMWVKDPFSNMTLLVNNNSKSNCRMLARIDFTISTNIKMIRHKIPRGCAYLQHINRAFQSSHAQMRAPGDLRSKKANLPREQLEQQVRVRHENVCFTHTFWCRSKRWLPSTTRRYLTRHHQASVSPSVPPPTTPNLAPNRTTLVCGVP